MIGFFGMTSAIPLATRADHRLFKFECVSTHIVGAPSQVTSTVAFHIVEIVICLAIRIDLPLSIDIRCLFVGSLLTFSTDITSFPWACSSFFIIEIIATGMKCTGTTRRTIERYTKNNDRHTTFPQECPLEALRSRQAILLQYCRAF